MSDYAIRAENLSKQYTLGQLANSYDTVRDQLSSIGAKLNIRRGARTPRETIWALDDVSFDIRQGEVVGIIGRNGAGKTTLLKLLSRITEPTKGQAIIKGRLRSLLEVGTGFHGELTGRENIFLNGAILGMPRKEVVSKFDEIVEFAGVDRFIDTPVKRYSSGMYVRLAFSVAAHLEPDVLLVDEVLAVGDVEFQRKCLGRMQSIGESGRTVLFVSHTLPTIARLCDRAILFEGGRLAADGPVDQVIGRYLESGVRTAFQEFTAEDAPGNDAVRVRAVRVVGEGGTTSGVVPVTAPIGIEIAFEVTDTLPPIVPSFAVFNEQGVHAFNARDPDPRWRARPGLGRYVSTAWIPPNLLNEGTFTVNVSIDTFAAADSSIRQASIGHVVAFQVTDPGDGTTARGHFGGSWPGAVRPLLDWSCDYRSA
jgi:lipopolysaccharide transport system ATP-binding protein